MTQDFLLFRLSTAGQRTALIASSKTVFRPFWVNAEHSKYFTARMSFAILSPCGYLKERKTYILLLLYKFHISIYPESYFMCEEVKATLGRIPSPAKIVKTPCILG